MASREFCILVVDDDDNLRRAICSVIANDVGQVPFDADCGAAAIQAATSASPDLVLLDLGLPDTKGYDVCRYLRDVLGLHETRVWFMTGDEREIREGMLDECAACRLLMKPSHPDQIRKIVRESMEAIS